MLASFVSRQSVPGAVRNSFSHSSGHDCQLGESGLLLYRCIRRRGWELCVRAQAAKRGKSAVTRVEGGEVGW